ncbi:MAG TPA: hypothetical protein VKN14_14975, partial [Flavobacteriaceae bacterium]|nr:hypothetical protein [Flavobacteriaceae bacterium]
KSIEKNPTQLQANYLESAYIENLGDNNFKVSALPISAQISPINGITINDFDLDGNLDALLVGNFYSNEVSYGQNDAFLGLLLKGNGLGGFTTLNHSYSGFMVNGDARALARINTNAGELILASVNNDSVKNFKKEIKDVNTIDFEKGKQSATIILENGKQRKVEIYYGEGYLSQSTKKILLPQNAEIKYN